MRLAADLVRKHGISEATLYNWKEQRGMDVSEGQHGAESKFCYRRRRFFCRPTFRREKEFLVYRISTYNIGDE